MVIKMKVKVAISNRHVHLSKNTKDILFGSDYELTKRNDISQIGQYACNETVTIKTEKNEMKNVRVLGPLRAYDQVEVSKTDSYFLGINPPVRDSGDLENSETVTIIGPKGEVVAKNSTIIAIRHIHIDPKTSEELGLKNHDIVKAHINSIKGGDIENVLIKCDPSYVYEMHLDTDDGNAFFLKNGDEVEFEKYL